MLRDKNFVPLHLPCCKSLKITVLGAVGPTSEIVIQKLLFMDKAGKSINHLVRKIAFSPKNAMDLFVGGKVQKSPSVLFVDPRVIVHAKSDEYTTVLVEFSRRVQVGAILFEIFKEDLYKNAKNLVVYADEKLIFLVGLADLGRRS